MRRHFQPFLQSSSRDHTPDATVPASGLAPARSNGCHRARRGSSAFPVRAWALTMSVLFVPALAWAQQTEVGDALNYSIIDLIKFGGIVGAIIILLSFVAVALVIEYALSIRTKTIMPAEDAKQLGEMIGAGRFEQVEAKADSESPSFLSAVVAAGVRERTRGYDAVVKAMEDCADALTGRLLRKIEHLNIIANIAPMLGLLGTVMGMVRSFNQISVAVGGVDPRRLAAGIFEALMTTVMGLVVAIPALYAFGIFRNRVDAVVAQASEQAAEIIEPLKNGDRR